MKALKLIVTVFSLAAIAIGMYVEFERDLRRADDQQRVIREAEKAVAEFNAVDEKSRRLVGKWAFNGHLSQALYTYSADGAWEKFVTSHDTGIVTRLSGTWRIVDNALYVQVRKESGPANADRYTIIKLTDDVLVMTGSTGMEVDYTRIKE